MRKLNMDELNRHDVNTYKMLAESSFTIVLDNVRSMHNVGSAFRSADAFGLEKIFLCGITACPPHREIHKTALGATESVAWEHFGTTTEAIVHLKKAGYTIVAVEQTEQATQLHQFNPNPNLRYAFVFGNEAFGVDEEALAHCDMGLEIPQRGTKHSFNIAVSIGIVLWHTAFGLGRFQVPL